MANLKYTNTLTHDVYEPAFHGFCLHTFIDNDTGDRMVEHNGFKNIDRQTVEDFKAIVGMLEIQLLVNEETNNEEI